MRYDPAMTWGLSGTENWFRVWRYGSALLWLRPIHWKGWLALGIQAIAGIAAIGLLVRHKAGDPFDPLWFVVAAPTIVLGWLATTRMDVVDLRQNR